MPEKSVSLSVRLSREEAAFLAGYSPPGATTLSEKLRATIAEAKRRRAGSHSYGDSVRFVEGLLEPALHRLREAETAQGMHSELLLQFGHWLPDVMAVLMVNVPDEKDKDVTKNLTALENAVADRIFAFLEQVLRLAVTGESPCYDPAVVTRRISTVVKLSEIIKVNSNEG